MAGNSQNFIFKAFSGSISSGASTGADYGFSLWDHSDLSLKLKNYQTIEGPFRVNMFWSLPLDLGMCPDVIYRITSKSDLIYQNNANKV